MPYSLTLTKFGNPILRKSAKKVRAAKVQSTDIQQLIKDMHAYMDDHPAYGVAIAAPQLNVPLAVVAISVKPTDYRPNVEQIKMTFINPEIVRQYGREYGMWEGCMSFGFGDSKTAQDFPYAQARRYKKVRLRYLDEFGVQQESDFDGLLAHIIQHEVDHLNGILFVDRVKDSNTYMMKSEYIKRYQKVGANSS